ncbi:DUF1501 domain-containing protein [Pontiella sulfatireligans]|uniref:DUF1501 domain-containing protein n=1 Tax=Pontiella sulfatireligans TaxID=2750658 RepID=A0A6C2UI83_9BACT|nr:DUF1501 domain-containing protein [Pontiella sulfatireligans]VGO19915.1 hypothetical protein SCARR_01975 [Pontiella sulfatireligans]
MKTQHYLNALGSLTRREILSYSAAGVVGSTFGAPLQASAVRPGKAKAVIQIWMWGGPSQLDTFDPKPDAGAAYCGPYTTPIETNVPGIRIGQMLPLLAQQADKYAIIRSMTHGINGHETASYVTQTGRPAGGDVFPCVGAVVSLFHGYDAGYKGLIPPYIVLTKPQGRFSESGFMGLRYKPFATGGKPNSPVFMVEGIVQKGITEARQRDRRQLLHNLETYGCKMEGNPRFAQMDRCEDQAYELILGDAGKVFDVSTEDAALRERYGKSDFGASCLIARRLVERGVPYVTINYGGWDTHKKHFEIMKQKLPELDKGFSTLLDDLSQRGLLDSTIVWWGGEFGRTPKVMWESPWNGGRGHYGKCFSHVVAGGGFQGGQVVGASNEIGGEVVDRPVYPWDLIGSIYEQLGIDTTARLPHPQGLDVRVSPTEADGIVFGGRLREIMS